MNVSSGGKHGVDITFITITYNQSEMVIQHLDSLLSVVNQYLAGLSIQLVIADDGSTDSTVETIENWLAANGSVFCAYTLLASESNEGTCKNYAKAIRAAEGKYIKPLAGDDVYLNRDISEAFNLLDWNDVVLTPSTPFRNESRDVIWVKLNKSRFAISQYLSLSYKKKRARLLAAPDTPGLFVRRRVFTESVLGFICEFDLIEDRSFWIKVLEDNEELRIAGHEESYVGYRYHDASVSKGVFSNTQKRYKADQAALSCYQIERCTSMSFKLLYFYEMLLSNSFFKDIRFFNIRAVWFNLVFRSFGLFQRLASRRRGANGR